MKKNTTKGRFYQMYTKDKSHRVTLRLNDEQFDFVTASADLVGISPSEFLRQVVTMAMHLQSGIDKAVAPVAEKVLEERQVNGRENDKTNQHNFV